MKESCRETNIQHLAFQRNASLGLAFLMGIALVVISLLLVTKSERVVVVPYGLEREAWVDGNKVSENYLERHGGIIANLLLNKTSSTAAKQRDFLLSMADPSFYGSLRKRLFEEEKRLKDQGVSYMFLPLDIEADTKHMTVSVAGHRTSYLGEKKLGSQREKYTLSFRFNGNTLLLTGVEREEVDNV